MNFFAAQDRARRSTRRLVFLYLLATAVIIAGVTLIISVALFNFTQFGYPQTVGTFLRQQAPVLIGSALITTLFIVGATLFKTAQLSSGGGQVAQQLGGTLIAAETRDPLRSRLRNVVEEMSIASGVPVPEIYVLEHETGINAFAAGFAPGDAAIAVTRGTLELLDRDELQGVIGHEFSHILNGDMRLNIRLMGVLFGILALGLMGRMILRGGRYSGFSSRRGKGAPAVLIIGLGVTILGFIGVFFARIIKAGVSRQREFLADASAVQFTRQNTGLANALKKIGGYETGSYFQSTDPEEVSHMLFGTGSKLSGLFATHPPLGDRIRALDPSFKDSDYPRVSFRERSVHSGRDQDERQSGLAATSSEPRAPSVSSVSAKAMAESVGNPNEQHVAFAAMLHQSVPEVLRDAAHSIDLSYLLVIALILNEPGSTLDRQLSLVSERLGEQRTRLVRRFYEELQKTGREYRLPLLEMAFPALRQRPEPQLGYLIELAARLIEVDGEIDFYEFCFYRILRINLLHVINPGTNPRRRSAGRKPVRDAAVALLRAAAHHGHENSADAAAAFGAGLAKFGKWGSAYGYSAADLPSIAELGRSLDLLLALNGEGRRMLLDAVTRVVLHDNAVTIEEAELIRAICASLEIPLPPQFGVSLNSDTVSGSQ